jgi:hypothetical protein
MKILKFSLAITVLLISTLTSFAQEKKSKGLIYLEADPFAYINKGYSIHPGYENWGFRFDLTFVKVDFPKSFEENIYNTTKFDLITHIKGIKLDYIGNRTNWTKGFFVGLDINHQQLNFQHRITNQAKNLYNFNIGLRTGYKIKIFKGFYITPWGAIWKNINSIQTFNINDDTVSTNKWDWILTLHFGYAIKL